MKTEERKIFEYIRSSDNVFTIPPYQRTYNWEIYDVKKLINDVDEYILKPLRVYEKNKTYYIGNLLAKRKDDNVLTLIDGQQRITTCILIAKVLHKCLEKLDIEKKYQTLAIELKSVFYSNEKEKKIKLNNLCDLHILERIINDSIDEKDKDSNFLKNYSELNKIFSKKNLEEITTWISGFNKLICIVIQLDSDENEHLVFESINSKGRRLLQSDLIKNYIFFLCNDDAKIAKYYNDIFLKNFKNANEEMDFFRMFECCTLNKVPESKNGTKIYESIKKKYDKLGLGNPTFDLSDLKDLKEFLAIYKYVKKINFSPSCKYIVNCAFNTYFPWIYNVINKKRHLITFEDDNEELKVSVDKNFSKYLDDNFKIMSTYDILRLFGGFHRAEAAKSVHLMPNKIEEYCKEKNADIDNCSLEEKMNFFYQSGNSRAFTIPQTFKEDILKMDMYSESQRAKALLWLYESDMRKTEKIDWIQFQEYKTLEHILPQEAKRNKIWMEKLSNNFDESFKKINTIGNLTILDSNANSTNSNLYFDDKKDVFARSHLELNRKIAEYEEWNLNTIIDRANKIKDFIEEKIIIRY